MKNQIMGVTIITEAETDELEEMGVFCSDN